MKSFYVSDFQPNQTIHTTFLVHAKDIRQKKSGEPYLSMMLGDRTGELDAKMWDNVAEVMDTFGRDDFVKAKGLIQIFHNRPQLTIHKMVRVEDTDVDFADYFPCSTRESGDMFAELREIVSGIGNPYLKALLDAFLNDERFAVLYRTAPAAKTVHHAYFGGLIEHVLSVCHLARVMAAHYKDIDIDLLLTGAILHDIGKTSELTYERTFGYSTDGQLLGHIIIGLQMIHEKLAVIPDFPPKLRKLLEHMIVSHHGELEYGSPKVPLFPEALLLHHLDNLDSKMECMRAAIAKDRAVDGCWTMYNAALDRSVLKKARYFEETTVETPEQLPQSVAAPSEVPPEPKAAPAAAAAPVQKPRLQRPVSFFAEKLQQAWRKGD